MPAPTKTRHETRTEALRRGSCLALYKRQDMRDALWASRRPRVPAPRPAGGVTGPVREGHLRGLHLEELRDRRTAGIYQERSEPRPNPVLDAWVGLVAQHMGLEDVCFFTGTYRDDYGYSHGLMLARNVQADFKRFLRELELSGDWTNSVEPHPSGRDILHCHALVGDCTGAQRAQLKA